MTITTVAFAIFATLLKMSPEFYIHNSDDLLKYSGVDGRIILRMIFRMLDGRHELN